MLSIIELTPEEKAQKIAKAMRKQSVEVKEKWENLNTCANSWQKQVDKALEKLKDLQCSMDDVDADLREAENAQNGLKPVGEILIDSLQDHIDKTTVSIKLLWSVTYVKLRPLWNVKLCLRLRRCS